MLLIRTPAAASSVCFGGAALSTLYVCSACSVWVRLHFCSVLTLPSLTRAGLTLRPLALSPSGTRLRSPVCRSGYPPP